MTESERHARWPGAPLRGVASLCRAHSPKGRRHVDVALVCLVLVVFETPAFDPYRHAGGPWWPLWGLGAAVPLLWRRARPRPVLMVTMAATLGAMLTRTGPDWGGLGRLPLLLGPVVALTTAASSLPSARLRPLAAVAAGALVITNVVGAATPDVIAAQLAVLAVAWSAGEAMRARSHEVALLRERITDEAARAAQDERQRIARELHDVVAHQLSIISIQAGAARTAAGEHFPHRGALLTIEEASRHALTDLRRALGTLRREDQVGGVAPVPGLDQLDRLAERLREAGLPLEVTTCGELARVPEGIGISVFRIVQEALTNVLNHAGRVATTVLVACSEVELRLEVFNEGPSTPPVAVSENGGRGLIGMRERAAALGGWLDAGALGDGGYAVRARIPLL